MSHAERIERCLLKWAGDPPPREALVSGDRTCEYADVAAAARRLGEDLSRNGIEPGDRVAIYFGHVTEAVVGMFGAWIAGAVAVPVNGSLKSPQVAHILAHSGSRVLLTEKRLLARLDAEAHASVRIVDVPPIASGAPRERMPLDDGDDLPGGDAPAAILYTSGSTGRPKGILLSHENLLAGTRIVARYLEIRTDERILSVLPFSFDYGLNQMLTAFDGGATLVLQRSHLPADVCRSLREQRISALAGVPPLWIELMDRRSPMSAMDLPHLRYITNSGGTFPADLARRFRARWPHVRMYLMYGLSEAFRSSYLPPEEVDRRPDSIGRAIPETELLVLDENGRECAPDVSGELVHRGPTVALGYWRDAEATARVFRPDPAARSSGSGSRPRVVFSGDVVKRDAEGYLYFVGRRDQLIKSYGYRVSPDEVEELIRSSKLVSEVAVLGRPDPRSGAAIVAHVVPIHPGDGGDEATFDRGALLDYCRRNMPPYMVPKVIEVHAALPRTASGKMDRRALSA
jgi:acyl-CoA ligase (AMP-forming) (exosortase A-associated)